MNDASTTRKHNESSTVRSISRVPGRSFWDGEQKRKNKRIEKGAALAQNRLQDTPKDAPASISIRSR